MARALVLASVPIAFSVALAVPLSSSTEFLFFPILLLTALAIAAAMGPLGWPRQRRSSVLEPVLVAVVALADRKSVV